MLQFIAGLALIPGWADIVRIVLLGITVFPHKN
jgi:hypothetical protein